MASAAEIKQLEARIKEDVKQVNELPKLVKALKSADKAVAQAAMQSTRRLLLFFAERGDLQTGEAAAAASGKKQKLDGAVATFRKWLWGVYTSFVKEMLTWLHSSEGDANLRTGALRTLMELVAREGDVRQAKGAFGNETFKRVVQQLVTSDAFKGEIASVFKGEFVTAYSDVQYYMMKNLAQVLESDFTASKDESEREEYELLVVANALRMVRMVQMPEVPEDIETFLVEPVDGEAADSDIEGDDGSEEEEEVEKEPAVGAGAKRKADDEKKKKKTTGVRSIKYHQHAFSMAWIALLRHRLPQDAYRRVLVQLPDDIMPHLANPLLLADFLTDSYNIGGVTSLLSLNSLFILIQDYNFDYPDFYNKLYELLNDPVLLTAKQRARFFGLLDLFLSSTHLPAYMVAAFAKRLSRSALTAEPGAILFIIPMVYNLILRHKECVQLIHRTGAGTVAEKAALRREELASANAVDAASKMLKKQKTEIALEHGQDPFQADEKDPIQCRALQSSLWELYSMRQHYNAEVAVRAKLFEDKLRQQFLDLDDCMDISYKSVFDAQLKRKEKGKVPLAFRPCTALFETATAETEAEDAREPDAFARVFAL